MTAPQNPIAAVTHSDPYAYYAALASEKPLYFDDELGMWVAASAASVTAVLTSDLCRVQPPNEPVPAALLGSSAAEIFQRLIRRNDGAGHMPFKHAVSGAIAAIDTEHATEQSQKWAKELWESRATNGSVDDLSEYAYQLPVYVVASLLGVPATALPQTTQWLRDFLRCLVPKCSPAELAHGKEAAERLLDTFQARLAEQPANASNNLLNSLAQEARRIEREDAAVIAANGIGFMMQACEATAGLIGNTLLALAAHPDIQEISHAEPQHLKQVMREVLRYDPPIQNTRRYLARSGPVGGEEMAAGDAILIVLAAANHDPAANPQPERFDSSREDRRSFTFGIGIHACPGETLALTIAQAGIEQIIAAGFVLTETGEPVRYHASANARIPRLPMHRHYSNTPA